MGSVGGTAGVVVRHLDVEHVGGRRLGAAVLDLRPPLVSSMPPSPARAAATASLDALSVSMVTMSTLGFGDITPAAGWLRIATPLEAFFGFALGTMPVAAVGYSIRSAE